MTLWRLILLILECIEEVSILNSRKMGVDDTAQMARDIRYVGVICFGFHVVQLLLIRFTRIIQ